MAFAFATIHSSMLIPAACAQQASDNETVAISVADGEQHLVKEVDPIYPPIAKSAHVEGTVLLSAIVSGAGSVESVQVIKGHPLLVQSAIDAVKQQQYSPFLRDGHATRARVQVEVAFSLPLSSEERADDLFAKQYYKCRANVEEQNYAEAVAPCQTLVEMAEQRPPDDQEDQRKRRDAYRYAGDAFWFQNKYAEAQPYYLKELETAEKMEGNYRELSRAYYDVAHGYQGAGNLPQAALYYQHAEQTREQEYAWKQSAFCKELDSPLCRSMKEDSVKFEQSALREYAAILRQTGDDAGADAAEQKANSLSVEAGPTKN